MRTLESILITLAAFGVTTAAAWGELSMGCDCNNYSEHTLTVDGVFKKGHVAGKMTAAQCRAACDALPNCVAVEMGDAVKDGVQSHHCFLLNGCSKGYNQNFLGVWLVQHKGTTPGDATCDITTTPETTTTTITTTPETTTTTITTTPETTTTTITTTIVTTTPETTPTTPDPTPTCTAASGARTCTCSAGLHGDDTLTDGEDFRGCFANPSGAASWTIKMRDNADGDDNADTTDAIQFDETAQMLKVHFEKSGGRDHEVRLFKGDCSTQTSDGLLSAHAADTQLAGVGVDTNNEYLDVGVRTDLAKIEGSEYLNAAGKVHFCVRVDLKLGDESVNFLEVELVIDVSVTADIVQLAVGVERAGRVIFNPPIIFPITSTYKLDACQCASAGALGANDRCAAADGKTAVAITGTKLTQRDLLSLCISTQTDAVEIEQIEQLQLAQGSGTDEKTFDVISAGGAVHQLAEYERDQVHIQRVKAQLLSKFFESSSSNTDITVTGKAAVRLKSSSRRRLANVVIKRRMLRQLEDGQEAESTFTMTVQLADPDTHVHDSESSSASMTLMSAIPLVAAAAFAL